MRPPTTIEKNIEEDELPTPVGDSPLRQQLLPQWPVHTITAKVQGTVLLSKLLFAFLSLTVDNGAKRTSVMFAVRRRIVGFDPSVHGRVHGRFLLNIVVLRAVFLTVKIAITSGGLANNDLRSRRSESIVIFPCLIPNNDGSSCSKQNTDDEGLFKPEQVANDIVVLVPQRANENSETNQQSTSKVGRRGDITARIHKRQHITSHITAHGTCTRHRWPTDEEASRVVRKCLTITLTRTRIHKHHAANAETKSLYFKSLLLSNAVYHPLLLSLPQLDVSPTCALVEDAPCASASRFWRFPFFASVRARSTYPLHPQSNDTGLLTTTFAQGSIRMPYS
ncbi:hypothetical protein CBL_13357 [Carabus blaptoides fortunei]